MIALTGEFLSSFVFVGDTNEQCCIASANMVDGSAQRTTALGHVSCREEAATQHSTTKTTSSTLGGVCTQQQQMAAINTIKLRL